MFARILTVGHMRLVILHLLVLSSWQEACLKEHETHHLLNELQRTRSLSGGPATDGNQTINEGVYRIFMETILGGFNVFRIKMYNDRSFIYLTRRNYWLGDRYFCLDNFYYLASRETCSYRLNETEREYLYYEDGVPIWDIFFQCQKFAEYCCGLDCCRLDLLNKKEAPPHHWKTPWDYPVVGYPRASSSLYSTFVPAFIIFLLLRV